MLRLATLAFFLVTLGSISLPAAQTNSQTSALRAKFTKEVDGVHKARILGQLADSEFRDIGEQLNADNSAEAGSVARTVADEAEATLKALADKHPDAEKHPSGYKELQITVRESLRRIDNIIVGLPSDEQQGFLDARKRLDTLDRDLIHMLFPARPPSDAPPASAAPAASPKP